MEPNQQYGTTIRRLIAKWTGVAYLRRQYKSWKSRRTVRDAPTSIHKSAVEWDTSSLYQISHDDEPHSRKSIDVRLAADPHTTDNLSDGELLNLILVSREPSISRAISEATTGQYTFQRILGSGSFSKVKLAIDRRTGEEVAIKMIDAEEVYNNVRLQETLLREVDIMRKVRHSNIVHFREVTLLKDSICLVMDYVPGQELFQYVAQKRRLSEEEAARILREVLLAIHYLHQVGVVHRDLKLENILIDPQPGGVKVTLIDFGLARLVRGYPLITRCGSEEYAAPEVIAGEPYDGRLSDSWSFGVILYACLIGSLPFNPDNGRPRALAEKIVSVTYRYRRFLYLSMIYRSADERVSSTAANLIRSLLVREPNKRLTIGELLRHPFFTV